MVTRVHNTHKSIALNELCLTMAGASSDREPFAAQRERDVYAGGRSKKGGGLEILIVTVGGRFWKKIKDPPSVTKISRPPSSVTNKICRSLLHLVCSL